MSTSQLPLPSSFLSVLPPRTISLIPISGGSFFLKGTCFRSKKKTQPAYTVMMPTTDMQSQLFDGNYECPAGSMTCNHLMALLRAVALLQTKGFNEVPAELSCTDLPQQWRVPRGPHIRSTSIQFVDWRCLREGGQDTPLIPRLYDSRVALRS